MIQSIQDIQTIKTFILNTSLNCSRARHSGYDRIKLILKLSNEEHCLFPNG